jgi:hypothetical protein
VRVLLSLGYGCGLRAGEVVQAQGQAQGQRTEDHSGGACRQGLYRPQRGPEHALAEPARELRAPPMQIQPKTRPTARYLTPIQSDGLPMRDCKPAVQKMLLVVHDCG